MSQPLTTVHGCVSTFVSVKPLDIFPVVLKILLMVSDSPCRTLGTLDLLTVSLHP